MNMKGNTLIETLIYIALLSLLMVGVFSSVGIMSDTNGSRSENEEELNLLLKNYHE